MSEHENDQPTVDRLRGIELPEIQFQQADLTDTLDFLANNAHCVCHAWSDIRNEARGDSVDFFLAVPKLDERGVEEARGEEKVQETGICRLPTVTLSATHITLMDAIRRVAEITGSTYEVRKDLVVFHAKKTNQRVQKVPHPKGVDLF